MNAIRHFIDYVRRQDNATKTRWIWTLSAGVMLVIIMAWGTYLSASVNNISPSDTKISLTETTNRVSINGAIINALGTLSHGIHNLFNGGLSKTNEIIINGK